MLHTILIAAHAVAATVAFVAGVLAVPNGRFLGVYRVGLGVMTAALVPAVLMDWASTDAVARLAFGGLFVLAVVMVVRGERAARLAPARTGGPRRDYVQHVGFTLIALADGFAVVAALRAGAPGWLVGLGAAAVVGAGHAAVRLGVRRLVVAPGLAAPS